MKKSKKNSQLKEVWRRFRKSKTALLGLVLLVVVILIALLADVIVPYETAIAQEPASRLQGPSAAHLFGTDELGRDLFARIIHGSRYSLLVGISTSIFSLIIGGLLGAIAAYYGGWVDNVIMRITDVIMTVPPILLSLAVVAALGANLRNLLIAITVSCVPSMLRMVRSTVLSVVDEDYIEAARSYGSKDMRVILKYVIPNALGPIIVTTTMNVANMILSAAGLSFLGLGVQPPSPEWGALLSAAETYMFTAPHLLYIPGAFIVIAALGFNLAGDGLRDALDPKLKN
ncbi:MAG: ABC transporter permease [Firmicutes bacterium]|nr:ABC transporter permease [Bacillota bacterium]MCR4712495.1 ABC transporter permease [Clostridia bacterium]